VKRHGPWRTLGIDPTDDLGAVRRAYADKLRALDIDRDVDGYTKLRNARDNALRLARGAAQAATDRGSPLLEGEFAEWDEFEDDWDDTPGSDFPGAVAIAEREDAATSDGASPSEPVATEATEPAPPQVLMTLLFPQGEISEEAMTPDEWERARIAFAAILHDAENAPIDRQAGIEDWLAHHLASAWPRSAWLVEDAAEAFGWLEESGQLNERPAIHFLNQRLKGMRFIDKVAQAGHPLHKAWVELSRPGRRGAFGFLRASKDDVLRLLAGIRERFPEVERHLDPERVASWEGAAEITPKSAWGPGRIILVISGIAMLRLCMYVAESVPPSEPPKIETVWTDEELIGLMVELFGRELDAGTLDADAPDLARTLARHSGDSFGGAGLVRETTQTLLQQLRMLTVLAARDAEFDDLVAIKQLKLELLRAAREKGGSDDCMTYARDGLFQTDLEVDESLRAKERDLAARLLASGLLRPSENALPRESFIPGSVIDRIRASTGFSEDTVGLAARGEGSDPVQCDYNIALLEAVLRAPATVPEELLRMM
jgi:hypothetical protein